MISKKAWVITVDMGYGHQRAAYPLKDIAYERIITANSDKIILPKEKKKWLRAQAFYEFISRTEQLPIIGKPLFKLFNKIQNISHTYPRRDLSKPSFMSVYIENLIKKGLGKSLISYIKKENLPMITTFMIPALIASYYKLENIYCIVTDIDISRSWVAKDPKKSNIIYLVPSEITSKRLESYAVPKQNIIFTGFPLPKENLGNNLKTLKSDLSNRLPNLDPKKIYINRESSHIKEHLGKITNKKDHILTLTYVVGGAGAQREIGSSILKSLRNKIIENKIKINLVAGTRLEIEEYFQEEAEKLGLSSRIGKNINIVFALNKKDYFASFNDCLRTTDILWTKPSELSFYTALGLPIIIAPTLGPHEEYNKKWLLYIGAGFIQEDPLYVNEWLYEWLDSGRLAAAALNGFLEAPKLGTYNIENVVFKRK